MPPSDQDKPVYGEVNLDEVMSLSFGPMPFPSHASLQPVEVESSDPKGYKLSFQFFASKYFKMRISRKFVVGSRVVLTADSPEMMEFVGVWEDLDDQKRKTAEHRKKLEGMSFSSGESFDSGESDEWEDYEDYEDSDEDEESDAPPRWQSRIGNLDNML